MQQWDLLSRAGSEAGARASQLSPDDEPDIDAGFNPRLSGAARGPDCLSACSASLSTWLLRLDAVPVARGLQQLDVGHHLEFLDQGETDGDQPGWVLGSQGRSLCLYSLVPLPIIPTHTVPTLLAQLGANILQKWSWTQ